MGMGGSCRGWLPLQVPEFRKSRQTVIFDNRGVAASEDNGEPFTFESVKFAVLFDFGFGFDRVEFRGVTTHGETIQSQRLPMLLW